MSAATGKQKRSLIRSHLLPPTAVAAVGSTFSTTWPAPVPDLTVNQMNEPARNDNAFRLRALCDVSDAAARVARIPVELGHACRDPLAVTMILHAAPSPVSWVFSVDSLSQGTVRLTGAGAIRLWPAQTVSENLEVVVRVAARGRSATVRLPRGTVEEYLRRVAQCSCLHDLDRLVDQELSKLLADPRQ